MFAKAGTTNWDADFNVNNLGSSDSGTDSAYGVETRFSLDSFSVRVEYEVYDLDIGAETASISAIYTF